MNVDNEALRGERYGSDGITYIGRSQSHVMPYMGY